MSNTRRTRTPRKPAIISPQSGEGREIGLDDREIPGGLEHLANPETPATKPVVPATRYFKKSNDHGVPADQPDVPYDRPVAGKITAVPPVPLPPEDSAVPVYLVEAPGKGKVRREVTAEQVTVPGNASDPVRLCSVDPDRVMVSLLVNDVANDVVISEQPSTIIEGRGAILPHTAVSYKELTTQGDLWALSTVAAGVKVSVILETEINA